MAKTANNINFCLRNTDLKGIRARTAKCKASNCMQMFAERKVMLLYCRWDYRFTSIKVNNDLMNLFSRYIKSYLIRAVKTPSPNLISSVTLVYL